MIGTGIRPVADACCHAHDRPSCSPLLLLRLTDLPDWFLGLTEFVVFHPKVYSYKAESLTAREIQGGPEENQRARAGGGSILGAQSR
jgi:hypothetical protein